MENQDEAYSELSHANKLAFNVNLLVEAAKQPGINLFMPGDGRYQPSVLKPFFGYDQWARWLTLVEWHWLMVLAELNVIPKEIARHLTTHKLQEILQHVTTTLQDEEEKTTKHDIIALLNIIKPHLTPGLRSYLHYGATSYDIIDTAYALQLKSAIDWIIVPHIMELDSKWFNLISMHKDMIQAGRTHLQTALPITIGFWLASLRQRFIDVMSDFADSAFKLKGKFSGAVGTGAAQIALLKCDQAEQMLMQRLGLQKAVLSTQIVPPESRANCYFQMLLLSGVLANLGEDVRILQSSQYGEVVSLSSSSSTMAHKKGNPILAENLKGMHELVKAEFFKVISTPALISDLQRDLSGSCLARSFSATAVYLLQMVLTAKRLLNSLEFDARACRNNFAPAKYLVMAELLHLALQEQGVEDSHSLVNKVIVPLAIETKDDLAVVMSSYVKSNPQNDALHRAWHLVPNDIKLALKSPEKYIGWAVERIDKQLATPMKHT